MLELENEAGLSTGLNVGVPLAIRATIIAAINSNTKPTRIANRFIYIKDERHSEYQTYTEYYLCTKYPYARLQVEEYIVYHA